MYTIKEVLAYAQKTKEELEATRIEEVARFGDNGERFYKENMNRNGMYFLGMIHGVYDPTKPLHRKIKEQVEALFNYSKKENN